MVRIHAGEPLLIFRACNIARCFGWRVFGNCNRQHIKGLPEGRGDQPIFPGSSSLPDQYFVVECKGTQSQRPAALNQLQLGTEQVVTVNIDPPAAATRLVIGSWPFKS